MGKSNAAWRKYYTDEREAFGKAGFEREFEGFPEGDTDLVEIIGKGGVISFPHTALEFSAALHARVVSSLYNSDVKEVIALGVFHGHYDQGQCLFRDDICEEIKCGVVKRANRLLAHEFSLDNFLAAVEWYAEINGVTALKVFPLYISYPEMGKRESDPEYKMSEKIAKELKQVMGEKTAVVCTGDWAHYGSGYSDPLEIKELGAECGELKGHFDGRLKKAYELLNNGKNKGYLKHMQIIRNDARYVLRVVQELLGGKLDYKILEFELSDYHGINGVKPPCYVASALAGFWKKRLL